jgi:hypothetical protein
MAAEQPKPFTVESYDCGVDDAKINELAVIVETQQEGIYPPNGVEVQHFTRGAKKNYIRPFDYRVMPWTVRCTDHSGEIHVRHYVARMNGDKEIVGWLVAQRRSDGMSRETARVYLSEISTIRIRKPEYRGVADALLTQFREDAVADPAVTFVYLYPLRPELEPVYKARGYLNYRELSTPLHTAPNRQYDSVRHMFLLTKRSEGKGITEIIPDTLMTKMIADVKRPRIDTMAEVTRIADRAAADGVEGADELVRLLKEHRLAIQNNERWKELQNELDNFNMFADEQEPMTIDDKIQALLGVAKSALPKGGRRKTRRFKMPRLMTRKYCKKTPCRRMGFTQRASCRPYKNCYTRKNLRGK